MVDQRIIEYLKEGLSKGASIEQMRPGLISQGWTEDDIKEAFDAATAQPALQSQPMKKADYINPPKGSSKAWIIIVAAVIIVAAAAAYLFMFSGNGQGQTTTTLEDTSTTAQVSTTSTDMITTTTLAIEQMRPENVKECYSDMECIISESYLCSPANVTQASTLDMFGMLITTATVYEIRGMQEERCTLYMKTVSQEIGFSDEMKEQMLQSGITQEEIDLQIEDANSETGLVEGRDGICMFDSNEELRSMLTKFRDGNITGGASCSMIEGEWQCTTTGDWEVADCEGTMFSSQIG